MASANDIVTDRCPRSEPGVSFRRDAEHHQCHLRHDRPVRDLCYLFCWWSTGHVRHSVTDWHPLSVIRRDGYSRYAHYADKLGNYLIGIRLTHEYTQ